MEQPIIGRINQLTFEPIAFNQKSPTMRDVIFSSGKSGADLEEFERLVKPLIEFLQTKCHPHMSIIVEYDRASLVEEICGVPFKVPD